MPAMAGRARRSTELRNNALVISLPATQLLSSISCVPVAPTFPDSARCSLIFSCPAPDSLCLRPSDAPSPPLLLLFFPCTCLPFVHAGPHHAGRTPLTLHTHPLVCCNSSQQVTLNRYREQSEGAAANNTEQKSGNEMMDKDSTRARKAGLQAPRRAAPGHPWCHVDWLGTTAGSRSLHPLYLRAGVRLEILLLQLHQLRLGGFGWLVGWLGETRCVG